MSCFLKGSTERDHTVAIIKLQGQLKQCMEKIKSSPHFYYFMEPVDTTEVRKIPYIYIYLYIVSIDRFSIIKIK